MILYGNFDHRLDQLSDIDMQLAKELYNSNNMRIFNYHHPIKKLSLNLINDSSNTNITKTKMTQQQRQRRQQWQQQQSQQQAQRVP